MPAGKFYKAPVPSNVSAKATQALKIAKNVARTRRPPEVKDLEYNSTYQPTNLGIVQDYGGLIAVGTGNNQRVGDTIKLKKILIRGYVTVHAMAAVGSYDVSRLIVFIDKTAQITTVGALLEAVGNAYAPLSAKSDVNRYKIKILHDKLFTQVKGSHTQIIPYTIKVNLDDYCNYQGSSNVVTTNDIKVAFINQAAIAGAGSVFVQQADVSYTDN